MWHYVLSRIFRNLHFDIEIVRNQGSEELLKLGGGQKIFTFRGEGLALWGVFNFLGGSSYPSASYDWGMELQEKEAQKD